MLCITCYHPCSLPGWHRPTLPHLQYHRHKRISLLCSEWQEVGQRYNKHLIYDFVHLWESFSVIESLNALPIPQNSETTL